MKVTSRILLIYILIFLILAVTIYFAKDTYVVPDSQESLQSKKINPSVDYKIALLADSHLDFDLLQSALTISNDLNVDYVIHVGDLSDFGGIENLKKSKAVLDNSKLPYLVLPGDRDIVKNGLEATLIDSTFVEVFEDKVCTTQLLDFYKVLCLLNPHNYNQISPDVFDLFNTNLPKTDIVISSQPIYNPETTQYMGFYEQNVQSQADELIKMLEKSSVSTFISGDTHFYTRFSKNNINYYTLGALTRSRNLQTPNFAVLAKYADGTIKIQQIELE